jgi:arylsulfatase A-like enzyme
MDLFPTALAMAGGSVPTDRVIDGRNLLPLLTGVSAEPVRDVHFYYRGATLYAARRGPWKAHFITEWAYLPDNQRTEHDPPLLYDLEHDPSERFDVAAEHPEVIADILLEVERHRAGLTARPSQLEARIEER